MKTNPKLYGCLVISFTMMACAFVQNMIFPPSPALELQQVNSPAPIPCTNDDCLNACLDRLGSSVLCSQGVLTGWF